MIKNLIKKIIGKNNILKIRMLLFALNGNYLTSKPNGSETIFLELYEKCKKDIIKDDFVKENFDKNEIDFINDLALITQITKKKSQNNYLHGFVISKFLKDYIKKTKNDNLTIFETGTSRGFSSIIMSNLLNNLNVKFNIHTIDILPNKKKIYWNSITDFSRGRISRKELLDKYEGCLKNIKFYHGISNEIIKKINLERINFAFLDGSHEYDDVKEEFNFVNKLNSSGDVIIFDDYTPKHFQGVVQLVDEIYDFKTYEQIIFKKNIDRGYAILIKK